MNPIPLVPRRRARRGLLAAAGAVLVAGCGDHSLILRVDLLSFLSPAETPGHYGPIPAGVSDSVTSSQRGGSTFCPASTTSPRVTDVQVDRRGRVRQRTGPARATGRIYRLPLAGGHRPVHRRHHADRPAGHARQRGHRHGPVTVGGDTELAGLFLGDEAELGIRIEFTSERGGAARGGLPAVDPAGGGHGEAGHRPLVVRGRHGPATLHRAMCTIPALGAPGGRSHAPSANPNVPAAALALARPRGFPPLGTSLAFSPVARVSWRGGQAERRVFSQGLRPEKPMPLTEEWRHGRRCVREGAGRHEVRQGAPDGVRGPFHLCSDDCGFGPPTVLV